MDILSQGIESIKNCFNCNDFIHHESKFCGNCGINLVSANSTLTGSIPTYSPYYTIELHHEINNTIILHLRERIIFLATIIVFGIINLIGIYMSLKCYAEFNGEDVSRIIMSITPLFYVNMVSLVCLQPLKKRKQEILRLKEKLKALNLRISLENSFRS